MPDKKPDAVRLRCPTCQSRLDVIETASGGRIVSVVLLGTSVEMHAHALEVFMPPNQSGLGLRCPACSTSFDPSGPRIRRPLTH
jgi:DNA-directed RNA polymerase subunit RPC12/RpoP